MRPIGQLTTVGSTVVGLAVDDNKLYVVAIDPATGNVRWRQQTSPSLITVGVSLKPIPIGGDKVAYLRPSGRIEAQLVIADAATGRDLVTSPQAVFDSPPYACADSRDACAISLPMLRARKHQYRLELATDTYQMEGEALPPDTRVLEPPSLLDLGDRPGNTLGWLRDGTIQWRVRVSDAFPPGFSSDNGWTWREFASDHVVVGSVFGKPLAKAPRYVIDLDRGAATAGISVDTGEVLWRDSGSSFECHFGNEAYPVRCRSHGIATISRDGPSSFDGLDVTVEGFDPKTGKTTWTIPMGPARALADHHMQREIAGKSEIVLSGPNGPIVFDYATGSVTAPPTGASYWCMTLARYEILPAYTRDGEPQYDRPGGELAAVCDAAGRPSETLPDARATIAAGAHVGGYAVIAARNGYIGFRVP